MRRNVEKGYMCWTFACRDVQFSLNARVYECLRIFTEFHWCLCKNIDSCFHYANGSIASACWQNLQLCHALGTTFSWNWKGNLMENPKIQVQVNLWMQCFLKCFGFAEPIQCCKPVFKLLIDFYFSELELKRSKIECVEHKPNLHLFQFATLLMTLMC